MNISRQQLDKLVVGTNDVSYVPPDTSPTGTAVLNGPVYIGKPSAAPGYEAALNVASNGAVQNPLDTQPAYQSSLAIKLKELGFKVNEKNLLYNQYGKGRANR